MMRHDEYDPSMAMPTAMTHVVAADRGSPIRTLDRSLAAKIAAGEVIDRPASVVKELLENAIDAGATRVRVELEGGGQALIRVQDDGCGIPADEVGLAFQRHATSKLAALDDLFRIRTLGFRGEALPSIAAVAAVELATRAAGASHGVVVHARGTDVTAATRRGLPYGTTVTVRDLFAAVPARLKFLKSRAGEVAAVQGVVAHYAMAYPQLRLTLYSDGRPVFSSPGSGALSDVLGALYGAEVVGRMLELCAEHRETTVRGLTSPPDLTRPSRAYQSFFVNGRWVRNRMLTVALEEAYHTHLMVGRHPICVVYLSLPPELVDVNVHPAKTEVKFLYDREVFAAVRNAASAAVLATMPEPGRTLAGLEPLGFQVEPFGTAACLVRAVPAMLSAGDPTGALRELLESRVARGGDAPPAGWRERSLTTIACRSAVKAGQSLSMEEMRQLIYRLETTARPRTCPHGRPTMILLTASQLEREFGRRG